MRQLVVPAFIFGVGLSVFTFDITQIAVSVIEVMT